jgi:hypothetical protein
MGMMEYDAERDASDAAAAAAAAFDADFGDFFRDGDDVKDAKSDLEGCA